MIEFFSPTSLAPQMMWMVFALALMEVLVAINDRRKGDKYRSNVFFARAIWFFVAGVLFRVTVPEILKIESLSTMSIPQTLRLIIVVTLILTVMGAPSYRSK